MVPKWSLIRRTLWRSAINLTGNHRHAVFTNWMTNWDKWCHKYLGFRFCHKTNRQSVSCWQTLMLRLSRWMKTHVEPTRRGRDTCTSHTDPRSCVSLCLVVDYGPSAWPSPSEHTLIGRRTFLTAFSHLLLIGCHSLPCLLAWGGNWMWFCRKTRSVTGSGVGSNSGWSSFFYDWGLFTAPDVVSGSVSQSSQVDSRK